MDLPLHALTGNILLVIPGAALSTAGLPRSHGGGPLKALPGDPMGGRHPALPAGSSHDGRCGTLAAPGRENLPSGGGRGGLGK